MAKQLVQVRLDPEVVEWLDAYAAERSVGGAPAVSRTTILEMAVKELRAIAEGGVPEIPVRPRVYRSSVRRERRCWRCKKCISRTFLTAETPEDFVPDCPDGHGPMVRDPNSARAADHA